MKTNSGFILLSALSNLLLCTLLLSSTVLAFNRGIKLYQRANLYDQALYLAQLNMADQTTNSTLSSSTTLTFPFKEVQISYDNKLFFNLVIYKP